MSTEGTIDIARSIAGKNTIPTNVSLSAVGILFSDRRLAQSSIINPSQQDEAQAFYVPPV